jgi:transcriptional regulator with XRE-family HTH domain
MTLGQYLKEARKKKGLSVRQLAKIVGVCHTSIYDYENDLSEPRISHLKWIAKALDISLIELVERI